MIVTIDGPAGAGKSTAARLLAERLGFDYLDTGAMYRAVALAGIQTGANLHDEKALAALTVGLEIDLRGDRVYVNGKEVTAAIRTPEVTERSRPVADSPAVRQHLTHMQRRLAQGRNLVTEGRDQGTVAFPNAECKFFLTADPEERARRRHQELAAKGQAPSFTEVLRAQQERDERDASRDLAPMKPAPDAVLLDSTHLTTDEVVSRMEAVARARLQPGLAKLSGMLTP